jgi:hypothetical protein
MSSLNKYISFIIIALAFAIKSYCSHPSGQIKLKEKSRTFPYKQITLKHQLSKISHNCHSDCQTCYGPYKNNCKSCGELQFLKDGLCFSTAKKTAQTNKSALDRGLTPNTNYFQLEEDDSIRKLIKAHAIINVVGWGFLTDIGIFAIRILRHRDHYVHIHAICFILNDFSTFIKA